MRGLCADERFVYAIDYGWTAGKPIYVFDPKRGEYAHSAAIYVVTPEGRISRSETLLVAGTHRSARKTKNFVRQA